MTFDVVKAALVREFAEKEKMQVLVDRTINIMMNRTEDLNSFTKNTEQLSTAAKFCNEQKFSFLSKAAIRSEQEKQCLLLRAPRTYKKHRVVSKE